MLKFIFTNLPFFVCLWRFFAMITNFWCEHMRESQIITKTMEMLSFSLGC